MDTLDPIFLISLAGGLTVLFFGRKLFWLYVGLVGVLAGFELTQEFFPQQSQWVYLTVAIVLGVVMASVAILIQYVAVALAGFVGGAYMTLQVMDILPMVQVSQLPDWFLVIPGVLGALICLLVFNPALIILSSLTGAAVLAQLLMLEPVIQNAVLVVLALAGMAVQFVAYGRRDEE